MPAPRLETRHGIIEGTVEDGLTVFRGVPYAAPPTGARRFRPPAEHDGWTGVRDCTRFGFVSPQPPPTAMDAIPGDPFEQSEDCLFLNVWTPGLDRARRPVMVFIHGGGFITGSSSVSVYHGAALARRGVVLVTLNYRLGVLGWLADEGLAVEGEAGFGNWGLHDQIAALRFVSEHAEALGGDPANVTVFGESAGAMSVAGLLGAPAARPLFRRAVMQSGSALALSPVIAAQVASDVAVALGLDGIRRGELERQPVEVILAAQREVGAAYGMMGLPFQPVVDGGLLPSHPASQIAAGAAAGIDILIGTNKDEWKFFTFSASAAEEIDEDRLLKLVERHLRQSGLEATIDASELIDVYRRARAARDESDEPKDLYTALGTDWVFRVPSARLAEAQAAYNPATYAYLFDWESPFAGGSLGACHALELPFVFGTTDNPFVALFTGAGAEVEALSDKMQAAWVAFATSGDPAVGSPRAWLPYAGVGRATRRFGRVTELVNAPMEEERSWLAERLGPYGVPRVERDDGDVAQRQRQGA